MRRLALTLLASSTLGLALGQAASGADMAVKYRPPAPPVVVPFSWTGFYVGGHIGAGWARKEWTDTGACSNFEGIQFPIACSQNPSQNTAGYVGGHNAKGLLGGIQAGYNWQTGAVVWGVEAQYSWADLKGDHQNTNSRVTSENFAFCSLTNTEGVCVRFTDVSRSSHSDLQSRLFTKIDGIGTIAARFGITSWPNDRTLFYVKGGAAYVKESFAATLDGTHVACQSATVRSAGGGLINVTNGCRDLTLNGALAGDRNRWGWMIGAGVEWGLIDNWSAKIEYNFLDFGKSEITLAGTGCTGRFESSSTTCGSLSKTFSIDQTLHVIKIGLNYRFDWGKAPVAVAARY